MPTDPATLEPATPRDLARERIVLAKRWPAAVRDLLILAARADQANRDAAALGLPPIELDPPLSVAAPVWAAIRDGDDVPLSPAADASGTEQRAEGFEGAAGPSNSEKSTSRPRAVALRDKVDAAGTTSSPEGNR